jgi:type IV pilus assembly protein PilA
MPTWLHKRLRREEGFTLIELLVVILIIGILAAIAIPAFLNQKGKGEDANAKASAREASTAMETYYTDNNSYACGTGATCDVALRAIENTLPPIGTMVIGASGAVASGSPSATAYRITVTSNPSGRTFWIDKNGGTVQRGCFVPTSANGNNGGCKNTDASGTGSW